MISPGHHLYRGPDGRWRCAAPGDRFFLLNGPPALLDRAQRLLHDGHDGGDGVSRATAPADLVPVLDVLDERGVLAPPVDASTVTGPGRLAEATVRVEGDNPIADQVRSLLAGHVTLQAGELDEDAVRDTDLVVDCAGWLPDARWRALGAACARHATPWHMTCIEGTDVVIGPMYLPGVTANYADVRGRRLAAAAAPDELRALWAYLDGDDPTPPVPWPDVGPAAMAAGVVVSDVVSVVHGRPCPTEGHQLLIDVTRAEVRRHRVLPLPDVARLSPPPAEAGTEIPGAGHAC